MPKISCDSCSFRRGMMQVLLQYSHSPKPVCPFLTQIRASRQNNSCCYIPGPLSPQWSEQHTQPDPSLADCPAWLRGPRGPGEHTCKFQLYILLSCSGVTQLFRSCCEQGSADTALPQLLGMRWELASSSKQTEPCSVIHVYLDTNQEVRNRSSLEIGWTLSWLAYGCQTEAGWTSSTLVHSPYSTFLIVSGEKLPSLLKSCLNQQSGVTCDDSFRVSRLGGAAKTNLFFTTMNSLQLRQIQQCLKDARLLPTAGMQEGLSQSPT